MTLYTIDRIVACAVLGLIAYSCVIFCGAIVQEQSVGLWIWDRHQNQFSWYSRPLFVLPAAYYAYRRKLPYIVGFMVLMATSLFWFEAPVIIPSAVSDYLEWERELFFKLDSPGALIWLVIAVAVFLVSFFGAIWFRNIFLGLFVVNIGTISKVVFSVTVAGEIGFASLFPSITSLVVFNVVGFLIWRMGWFEYRVQENIQKIDNG